MTTAEGPNPDASSRDRELRRAFRDGGEAYAEGRLEDALAAFRRVVSYAPGHVASWINLAVVWRQLKRPELSVVCLRRALEIEPQNPGAWTNLGNALKDLQRYPESLEAHGRALAIDDARALHWHNYGVTLRETGDAAGAVTAFDRAIDIDPGHVDAHWDRALSSLVQGRFERAWDDYEWRWRLKEMASVEVPPQPLWNGENLAGRTLLVYGEQGFGDTILALRYLRCLGGLDGRVVLHVRPELARLLGRQPNVDTVVARGEPMPRADLRVPLMSLLGRYTPDMESIPPVADLVVPQDAGRQARDVLRHFGRRFKVGIVWSGSVTFKNNHRRAVDLEMFLPLAEIPGVQLFSLQKGPPFEQYKQLRPTPLVVDLGSLFDDFADTAATLHDLDLVIMTDSSVAHLAGTLGVPIWNLLDWNSYWIYFTERDDTPWYPSMRLFRQSSPGDWDGAFRHVREALETHVAAQRAAGS